MLIVDSGEFSDVVIWDGLIDAVVKSVPVESLEPPPLLVEGSEAVDAVSGELELLVKISDDVIDALESTLVLVGISDEDAIDAELPPPVMVVLSIFSVLVAPLTGDVMVSVDEEMLVVGSALLADSDVVSLGTSDDSVLARLDTVPSLLFIVEL